VLAATHPTGADHLRIENAPRAFWFVILGPRTLHGVDKHATIASTRILMLS